MIKTSDSVIFVCDRIDKNVNQPWEGVPGLISDDEEEHY